MKNQKVTEKIGIDISNTAPDYEAQIKELNSTIDKLNVRIDELEFEQQMFHELLSAIPDNIYFKDRKSRFTILSQAMSDWFGEKNIDDVIGKTDFDMFT